VAGSPQARLLEGVSAQDLVPGCTPVVNLFPRRVRPVPDSREPARYTVVADVEKPWSCEVYALERLRCGAEQSRPDDASPDIPPLFSLHPGRFTGPDLYWVTPDDADDVGPVHGALIALVTAGMEPVPLDGATLWADITATNADLPMALEPGSALDLDGGRASCTARLLHQPTPSRRFDLRGQAPWRLISHLSPNHLWLCDCGIEAIRDMLQLYDLPRSASSQRLVQGMQAVDARPASALLYDPEPYLARGTELCLTVDEACFGDTGPLLFAWVMERWFAQLAHINSFTRLKLVSARGTEVFSGKTRPGDRPLL
jgi:type VI secretion system protein ImpG